MSWLIRREFQSKAKLFYSHASLFTKRKISQTPRLGNYEGDGKTTVTILNTEENAPLMIDSYHRRGFTLNNGYAVLGPVAVFPKSVLSWDVGEAEHITPESLMIFTLLEPKLDLLIIGYGDEKSTIPIETIQMLRKNKISFEATPTEHALKTYNFLVMENRCVAAALLPPKTIRHYDYELFQKTIGKTKEDED